ncbi:hypothetical protein [Bacillus sp. NPDC077027]|uniref:hypothetical protein n=1 Tax=Bacillus sp. NPDC077027 TaxID=3390548 RepID=UPI003CFE53F9
MGIQEIIEYLKGVGIDPVYPLAFPADAPNRAYMLETGQGFGSRGSVNDVVWTVTMKAEHPNQSESMGKRLIDLLDRKTDLLLGENQIIYIKSQQLIPDFLGKSSEGSYYHMVNFKVLVSD